MDPGHQKKIKLLFDKFMVDTFNTQFLYLLKQAKSWQLLRKAIRLKSKHKWQRETEPVADNSNDARTENNEDGTSDHDADDDLC